MDLSQQEKIDLRDELITEATGSYTNIENEKEGLKEALVSINERYGISPKLSRRLIKSYYCASIDEQKAEFDEFTNIYEEIIG